MAFTALPAETWGRRFKRAREEIAPRTRHAKIGQREIASQVSAIAWRVSKNYITRLEQRTEPPDTQESRIIAAVALICYGVDPETVDIDLDELPEWVRYLRDQQSPCMTRRPALARTG